MIEAEPTVIKRIVTTNPLDPAHVRAEATRAGKQDASYGHPRSSSGELVTDYFGTAADASARTAATLHLAEHLRDARPRVDRTIAQATSSVVRLTAAVGDALTRTSAADHESQAFKRLPLATRREPWPQWLRLGLLGAMALGTGAALSGALLTLTADDPYYVWAFCLATTLAVVGLGAFLAHTARSLELNRLKSGQFTAGWLPKAVLGVGAVFVVLLMVALAEVRGTAAEADAARQARAEDGVTVFLPGQAVTEAAPEDAVEVDSLPSVPAWAFGVLEGVLFMAAFGVEYLNVLPWAEQRRKAGRALAAAERALHTATAELEEACAGLMAGLGERADIDSSVLLTGEATISHVTAEVGDYRRALLAHHPSAGGDPFAGSLPDGDTPVLTAVVARWGRDLQAAGLIVPDVAYDQLDPDQVAPTALARGLAMLARVPERASFVPLRWDPAALVDDALPPVDGDPPRAVLGVRRKVSTNGRTKPPAAVAKQNGASGTRSDRRQP